MPEIADETTESDEEAGIAIDDRDGNGKSGYLKLAVVFGVFVVSYLAYRRLTASD